MFERFARLDEARTTDRGGAGLGLAIVASVAAAHGGGAEAGDSPLGGARLSLWLPLSREEVP
jgi:signal transduction histidine kinase